MMGCAGQAQDMDLYEYEERLWHWNEAHATGDEPVELPDPEVTERLIQKAMGDKRLTN